MTPRRGKGVIQKLGRRGQVKPRRMPYDFSLWKRLEILKVEKDGDIIE